jgi:hypothetical protein
MLPGQRAIGWNTPMTSSRRPRGESANLGPFRDDFDHRHVLARLCEQLRAILFQHLLAPLFEHLLAPLFEHLLAQLFEHLLARSFEQTSPREVRLRLLCLAPAKTWKTRFPRFGPCSLAGKMGGKW